MAGGQVGEREERETLRIAVLAENLQASIIDDAGRTVAYSYDADGRLTGVADLADGQWRMGYAGAGRLSSITDPRSKVVLAAAWTEARVRRIRVLHETTDFAYADSATTATNLLGWATVYRRDDAGITTSITDRTGATTELAFDSQHRPVTVTRDGATVARVGYDGEGRLQSLWQPAGETAFTTNNRGEVTVATGAWTARYRYDQRRVVHADDSGGVRSYRYDEHGTPAGATVDGVDTALRTNADGTLAGISREGRSLAAYSYVAGGRVSSIDYGGGTTATFVYDARGLRTSGSYAYGQDNRIEAEMSYDAAGNLTRIEHGVADGESSEQTYVVGDYNEVLQVRSDDGQDRDRPDMSFEYDAAGRMQRATLGSRTATVEYDALDRTTRLAVDGGTILEHGYAPDDADAARQEDLRTGGVLVAAPLSPVFGTMESIVYARPRFADHGLVAYSPSRKTFEVRPDALAADALLLASLHARMVPLGGEEPNAAPFGHDKPSNGLFIPPEFKAVNCYALVPTIRSATVELSRMEPEKRSEPHCRRRNTTVATGGRILQYPDFLGIFRYGARSDLPWYHATDFGDESLGERAISMGQEVLRDPRVSVGDREYTMSTLRSVCHMLGASLIHSIGILDSVTFARGVIFAGDSRIPTRAAGALPVLRLTCCSTLIALRALDGGEGGSRSRRPPRRYWHEKASTSHSWGGCADTRLDGVWLAVRAESAKAARTDSLEMWFADASAKGSAALRRMHVVPAPAVRGRRLHRSGRDETDLVPLGLRNCAYTACRATGWRFSPPYRLQLRETS